jgi:hypothetical protein
VDPPSVLARRGPPAAQLVLAYGASAAVLLVGIGFLLPHLVEIDAWFAVGVQAADGWPPIPPDTPRYYGLLVPALARAIRPLVTPEATTGAGPAEHLALAAATPLACRVVVALGSAGVAPATLAIAARFLPRGAAWTTGAGTRSCWSPTGAARSRRSTSTARSRPALPAGAPRALRHAQLGAGYVRGWPAGADGAFPFVGQIAGVVVDDRALDAAEVARLYAERPSSR